jgi:hypothetical protein
MRSRSGVVIAVAVVVCAFAATAAAGDKYGVGFVPFMEGGDKVENMLHRFVGEMPEIDQMFDINDGDHMLKTLVKLKKQGKRLDFLVLAAHGSRDTPGMKWAKDDMIPEEINLAWQKGQLAVAKRMRAAKGISKEEITKLDTLIRTTSATVKLLEEVPGVMKPNAIVLMINCSAAATANGRAYVATFGNLLLGADGGHIISSSNDIIVREVEDINDQVGEMWRNGGLKEWGAPYIKGSWITLRVPKGSNNKITDVQPAPPAGPTPSASGAFGVFVAGDVVMVGTRKDVEAFPTCRITGWGVNCNRTFADAVVDGGLKNGIQMIEGPFPDFAGACKKFRELEKSGKFQREKIRTGYATGC